MAEHWPELVTALTGQSIESVGLLLRGLDLLVRKGRLSQAEYKVLAQPAERLKHVGMSAQQIVRFQSGQVRQSHEKIDLAYLLECVLQERRHELALLGLTVWRKFAPVDVLMDPTLGFSLTQAMLDWSMSFGHRIDLRLDLVPGEPARARLRLKTYSETPPPQNVVFEDGIHWLLLSQIAATDGAVEVERSLGDKGVTLTALFGRTLAHPDAQAVDARQEGADSRFKSVSGSHVLLLTPDESTRLEALAIIQKLGIGVEAVSSPEQVAAAMRQHGPDLIVIDRQALDQEEDQDLRPMLARDHPQLPVIEIVAAGTAEDASAARTVARDALRQSLGSAVMFTLSRLL